MKRRPLGRLVMALVPLPWTAFYAVMGGWFVAKALPAVIGGDSRVPIRGDAVASNGVLLVGIGFLVAFAATLGVTVLVLLERRGRLWTLELVVLLAVWAGGLWAIYRSSLGAPAFLLVFFGLFFATAVAAVMVVSRPPEVIEAGPGKSTSA
ncbi:MAG: hypothetical protein JW767_11375 [Thermoleophilia bacterium]|nr:hypothetical protein [Thermoleophilia bacterium]